MILKRLLQINAFEICYSEKILSGTTNRPQPFKYTLQRNVFFFLKMKCSLGDPLKCIIDHCPMAIDSLHVLV